MTIGERINARRRELGLTEEELAARVGYTSKTTICKIEKGCNSLRQDKIMKFASALETTPEYIMGWDEIGAHNVLSRSIMILVEQLPESRQEDVLDYVTMLLRKEARK